MSDLLLEVGEVGVSPETDFDFNPFDTDFNTDFNTHQEPEIVNFPQPEGFVPVVDLLEVPGDPPRIPYAKTREEAEALGKRNADGSLSFGLRWGSVILREDENRLKFVVRRKRSGV